MRAVDARKLGAVGVPSRCLPFFCYRGSPLKGKGGVRGRERTRVAIGGRMVGLCIWSSCDMLNHVDWCFYLGRDEKNRKRLRIKAGNRMTIDVSHGLVRPAFSGCSCFVRAKYADLYQLQNN